MWYNILTLIFCYDIRRDPTTDREDTLSFVDPLPDYQTQNDVEYLNAWYNYLHNLAHHKINERQDGLVRQGGSVGTDADIVSLLTKFFT